MVSLHNLIIEKRDQAVAHSDWVYRNTELIDTEPYGGVLRKHSTVNYASGIDGAQFRELAHLLQRDYQWRGFDHDSAV